MNTVQAHWDTLKPILVPAGSSASQLTQSKLCFYAGVEATLRVLDHIGGDDVSEDAGVALLQSMRDECHRFAREYGASQGLPEFAIDMITPAEKKGTSQ